MVARHKLVKNLDLDDEIDDFDGVDENEQITEEDQEELRKGLIEVRDVIGPDVQATDQEIRDTLWHYYFDVPKSISWILNQHTPKQSKRVKTNGEAKVANKANGIVKTCYATESMTRHGAAPFNAAAFFKDSPWLNIPKHRQTEIIVEPLYPPGGLLGGAPPKQSKLAALAAARRKKDGDSKVQQGVLREAQNDPDNKLAPSRETIAFRTQKTAERSIEPPKRSENKAPVVSTMSPPTSQPARLEVPVKEPFKGISSDKSSVHKKYKQAEPSTFATTMFSNARNATDSNMSHSEDSMFSLPYASAPKLTSLFSFTDPSPDDIVLKAQSARGSKKKQTESSDAVAEKLKQVSLETPPPKVKSKNLNVQEEYAKIEHKCAANFVVIGHVDAGKSTLMGRLLFDLKAVNSRTIDKYKKEAARIGKASFALAWVLDEGSEERDRGVTIDIATNTFETDMTKFTILDAPGHRDFISNMIAGASQADFAVLVLDASPNSFESGLRGQTKEHALLVRSAGVQRLIVAVNKLDTVKWSQSRFTDICQQTAAFLSAAGFPPDQTTFIPCSGLHGQNITSDSDIPSELKEWYDGPTLLFSLEDSATEKSSSSTISDAISAPLRLQIWDVFRAGTSAQHQSSSYSISGRIETGNLQVGDPILILPSRETCSIRGIDIDSNTTTTGSVDWAVARTNVTLHLADLDPETAPQNVRPGDVVCSPTSKTIELTKAVTLKILAFEHVMPSLVDVIRGRMHVSGRVEKLVAELDKTSGQLSRKKPRVVKPGVAARVVVALDREAPLEKGMRVVLRAEGETLAAGLVE